MGRMSGWRVLFMVAGAVIAARGLIGLVFWDQVSLAFTEALLAQLVAGVAFVLAVTAGVRPHAE